MGKFYIEFGQLDFTDPAVFLLAVLLIAAEYFDLWRF